MDEKNNRWKFNPAVTSPNPKPLFRFSCNAALPCTVLFAILRTISSN
jgi:hypothetical protein